MEYRISIIKPFLTVEEFQHLVSEKVSKMIKRLVRKSPQLIQGCGMPRVLLGLSVAWGMLGAAKAGCTDAFDHIDDAISPPDTLGYVMIPKGGCVMVSGKPFIEREQVMLHFIWDGFAIFIEDAGLESVAQSFFDLAGCHQHYAYQVMAEQENEDLLERKLKLDKDNQLINQEPLEDNQNQQNDNQNQQNDNQNQQNDNQNQQNDNQNQQNDNQNQQNDNQEPLEDNLNQQKDKHGHLEDNQNHLSANLMQWVDSQKQLVVEQQSDLQDGEQTVLKTFCADMVDAMLEGTSMDSLKEMQGILEKQNRKYGHLLDDEMERLEYLYNKKKEDNYNQNNLTINNKIVTSKMGDTYHISGDFVKGDKVMGNKYVNSSANTPEQEALKASLEQLLEAVDGDGKPLLHAQNQWFGVYRVMVDDYGWRESGFVEFCRRINALGLKPQVACKVDALKKVNQMPPFYKAYAEWEPKGSLAAYNRQKEVVEKFKLLMEENLA